MHLVATTPLLALHYLSAFAIQLVQDLFRRYTKVDSEKVLELGDRFCNLEIDSRLEVAFEGNPKGFAVPSYSDYNYQSTDVIVISELETRIGARYIPLGEEYEDVEVECTDFLSYYLNESDVTEDTGPCRISFTTVSY